MIPLIEANRTRLESVCREFGVERLDLFGSATSERFRDASSDLDFVADFGGSRTGIADRYLDFAEALEGIFGRRVEILTERSIRNPIFRRAVERERQRVYERSG
jgi:predicted nucleotidyltransferase